MLAGRGKPGAPARHAPAVPTEQILNPWGVSDSGRFRSGLNPDVKRLLQIGTRCHGPRTSRDRRPLVIPWRTARDRAAGPAGAE